MRILRALLRIGVITLVALAALAIGAGQMGLFSGERPADLGLKAGKLRGGDSRPNWVSSQVAAGDKAHYVEPIRFTGPAPAAWDRLLAAVKAQPGATVVQQGPGYLHAEFRSRVLGFVDDAEFALDEASGSIHLRAGARLGIRDFDVNRKRMEAIRAGFAVPARAP